MLDVVVLSIVVVVLSLIVTADFPSILLVIDTIHMASTASPLLISARPMCVAFAD